MPLLVTADDITQALIKTDALVNALDANVSANAIDANVRRSWEAFRDGYRAFSANNRALPWYTLGLPAIADQEIAYEHELAGWQSLIDASIGRPTAPGPVAHDQVDETGHQTIPTLDTSTKFLIGGALVLGFFLLLKK